MGFGNLPGVAIWVKWCKKQWNVVNMGECVWESCTGFTSAKVGQRDTEA